MYYLYILYSKLIDKYYIGQSNNLEQRLEKHLHGSSKYTKQANDWEIVYCEKYGSRAEAMNREKQIKRMKSRKYIENLVRVNVGT